MAAISLLPNNQSMSDRLVTGLDCNEMVLCRQGAGKSVLTLSELR